MGAVAAEGAVGTHEGPVGAVDVCIQHHATLGETGLERGGDGEKSEAAADVEVALVGVAAVVEVGVAGGVAAEVGGVVPVDEVAGVVAHLDAAGDGGAGFEVEEADPHGETLDGAGLEEEPGVEVAALGLRGGAADAAFDAPEAVVVAVVDRAGVGDLVDELVGAVVVERAAAGGAEGLVLVP